MALDPAFGTPERGTPAPCRAGCPVGTDAAAYVALLAEGRVAEAYDVARQHNPFPSVCGRVCSAPCERVCRRGVVDAPIAIRALKRVLCDVHGAEQGENSRWARGLGAVHAPTRPSVGIIGAGPAGLAAAHDLRLAGHAVTVYESSPIAGGMMLYGIPAFRLPRSVIAAEIAAIEMLGVSIRTSCAVGRDLSIDELLETHAAVLVTVGCQQGRALGAPGADLPGVIRAVDFLRLENARLLDDGVALTPDSATNGATNSVLQDGPVVVIGGGSVAFDAARSAWRSQKSGAAAPAGAASSGGAPRGGTAGTYDDQTALDAARSARRDRRGAVTLVAPEARHTLRVPSEELHEADTEGVGLRDGMGVVRIVGTARVEGVEVAPVTSLFDAEGRFNPQLDTTRAEVLPADTVVLAIGQQADTDFLSAVTTVQREPWGGVRVDAAYRTTDPRVWAAGDVSSGPRDLIDAIAAGQRAAASIAAALMGAEPPTAGQRRAIVPPSVATAPPMPRETRFWSRYDDIARASLPVLDPSLRTAVVEVEDGFDRTTGQTEGARCLRCDEHMQFAPERCIACALCVDVCPQSSLALEPAADRLALIFDDNTCIRCGLCVHRCPTDALLFTLDPASSAPVLPAIAPHAIGAGAVVTNSTHRS